MGHVGGGPTSTDVQWDSGGSKSPIHEHLILFGLKRYWLLDSPHLGHSIHADLYPPYALAYLEMDVFWMGMDGFESGIGRAGPWMPFLGTFLV